ncbi:MAG: serine/threonine protein kinase [Phycisphaerae bacterium]|nr:serine/threonine-protein kinase [Phycisphaerae bacterium]NUQ47244.1 serine/threonine protein kinase [Phycisphaerae bacterium]
MASPPPDRDRPSPLDDLPRGFGLDLPDDEWLERIRQSRRDPQAGAVGGYEIESEISRGAQGIVYRARQPNTQRHIALKRLIAGSFATSDMRARFEREMRVAAELHHPNIVTVYGAEIVDGQPNLAMEWIDGKPVDRWAVGDARTRRGVDESLRLFAVICDAVHHAHQRGVIHRDLKPSNILVDDRGQPHILDFGLAKLMHQDDSAAVHLTRTRDFVGTPAYASPEQVRGDASAIDLRSDVYALGVILFQMLTGRLPYPDDRNLANLLHAIQHVDPPPPSSLAAPLGTEIDAIVLKALAKSPADRYASVDALAADVRRYLADEPVLAHPPTAFYQFRKLIARRRLPFALGTTVAMLVLALAIVTTVLSFRLDAQRRSAVEAQQQEARARQAADEVTLFLRGMLASVDPDQGRGRDVTVREVLDRAADEIDKRDDLTPEVDSAVRDAIGVSYFRLGFHDLAGPHLEKALDLARAAYGGSHPIVAARMQNLANFLRADSQLAEAQELYQQVYDIRCAVLPAGHRDTATALANLAGVRIERNDLEAGEKDLDAAIEMHIAAFGPDHLQTVGAQIDRASIYQQRGQTARAADCLVELMPRVRAAFGPQHSRTLQALNNAAVSLRQCGRAEEALPYLEEAVSVAREIYGDEHPNTINLLGNLGNLHQSRGELDRAGELLITAMDRARTVLGPTHATTLATMNNLAGIHQARGDLPAAVALLRESLAGHRALFGEKHPATAISMAGLGAALMDAPDAASHYEEAEELLLNALRFFESAFPPDHRFRLTTIKHLGRLYSPEKMDAAEKLEQIAAQLPTDESD